MSVTLGPRLGLLINADGGDNYTDQFRPLLRFFDSMVQGSVINSTTTAPPTSPANGDAYLLLGSPTGAWAAYANSIAVWSTEITTTGTNTKVPGWEFWTPNQGWVIWDVAAAYFHVYTASGWVVMQINAGGGGGAFILEGADASKPTAGTAGRIYLTTDTNRIYYDTATAWIEVGPSGTGLPSGAANQVLATPSGSTGQASLRSLTTADIPRAGLLVITWSGSLNFDFTTRLVQKCVITGNTAITFSNAQAGDRVSIILQQDSTGGHTVTWANDILSVSGSGVQANKSSVFTFIYDGTNYLLAGDVITDQ